MTRQTGVTTETYERLILDAGVVYRNWGESNQALIGATRGGSVFTVENDYREMPVDSAFGPVKGSRRIVRNDVSLVANFIEHTAELLQTALPGSSIADYPATVGKTHDQIIRALQIALSDYATNVAIVAQVSGTTNPVVCILKNALADSNLELSFADADEAVNAITFKAHFDPDALDTEPWEILYPSS